jgi:hypothetical protein
MDRFSRKIEISTENLRFLGYFTEFFCFIQLYFSNKPKRASGLCGAAGGS